MGELDFEQRNRLETEVLPAVIGDPEYAAATIVRLEARVAELQAENERLKAHLRDADGRLKTAAFTHQLNADNSARLRARVAEYAPLQPPSESGREVFESVVKNNPDADMRAVPNEWVTNQRTITEEVAAKLEARVAELVARLLNLVTAVELSSAVVVSQSVSEAMADARTAIAGKEGE